MKKATKQRSEVDQREPSIARGTKLSTLSFGTDETRTTKRQNWLSRSQGVTSQEAAWELRDVVRPSQLTTGCILWSREANFI